MLYFSIYKDTGNTICLRLSAVFFALVNPNMFMKMIGLYSVESFHQSIFLYYLTNSKAKKNDFALSQWLHARSILKLLTQLKIVLNEVFGNRNKTCIEWALSRTALSSTQCWLGKSSVQLSTVWIARNSTQFCLGQRSAEFSTVPDSSQLNTVLSWTKLSSTQFCSGQRSTLLSAVQTGFTLTQLNSAQLSTVLLCVQ